MIMNTEKLSTEEVAASESGPIDTLLDQIERLEHRLENLDNIEKLTRANIEESLTPIEKD